MLQDTNRSSRMSPILHISVRMFPYHCPTLHFLLLTVGIDCSVIELKKWSPIRSLTVYKVHSRGANSTQVFLLPWAK